MSKFKVGDKVVKANGEKWLSGAEYKLITEINFWREEYRLSGIGWWDEKKLKLYEEIKEMKELTFKEVIANIKEGEVWKSEFKSIQKRNGIITIENLKGSSNIFAFNDSIKYKLQRKEYTFEEAFKAYEEGKEIESVISAYRIKKLTDGRFRISQKSQEFYTEKEGEVIITLQEIQGGWYIND